MDDLPVVQSLWIGGELSKMEISSINSFIDKGNDYHLYTYGEVKNIPERAKKKEARNIISEKGVKEGSSRERANFADIFRYKLLRDVGGIWVDTDIICMRPFTFEKESIFASERVQRQSKFSIRLPKKPVNCVMKFPKESEVMNYCYEKTKNSDPKKVEWAELGTKLIGRVVKKFRIEECVHPFWSFCPISWWNWKDFIKESKKVKIREKIKNYVLRPYSYHLWNSEWSDGGADKDKKYPKSTIYGELQKINL